MAETMRAERSGRGGYRQIHHLAVAAVEASGKMGSTAHGVNRTIRPWDSGAFSQHSAAKLAISPAHDNEQRNSIPSDEQWKCCTL